MQSLSRFLIGGVVVSLFAILGDVVRPRSLAGVFGAAPSVALGTLALTVHFEGPGYAAIEARSMVIGAAATLVYAWICARTLWRGRASVLTVTLTGLGIWLAVAATGWLVLQGVLR